jgi:type IX secretion system PorP/SprF family membrane protein
MNKLNYFFCVLLVFTITDSIGQQLPQYSQYLINDYVLNPAVGGSNNYFEAKSNHRFQWVGLTDAPRTFILSINGPLKTKNMGVGGYIFTDVTGPTSRFGAYFSYAYHIQINSEFKLGMGLFGGILQYNVDGSKITLLDKADTLGSTIESVTLPDAGFGLYGYSEKFYFGFSIPQLLQNKLKLNNNIQTQGKLTSHILVTTGYKFEAGNEFEIEPSILLKYVNPVPIQFDFSTKVTYQKTIWIGASYRTQDAMSALLGYVYKDQLLISYSFDFTTSNLKNYSAGTHEIMLGIRFENNNSNSSNSNKGLVN